MPFRFESDQFLVFVSRADDVTTLHIESAADEKAMRKILADFGLSHLPIEARADKPFNNAMEAFIADSSDLSDV